MSYSQIMIIAFSLFLEPTQPLKLILQYKLYFIQNKMQKSMKFSHQHPLFMHLLMCYKHDIYYNFTLVFFSDSLKWRKLFLYTNVLVSKLNEISTDLAQSYQHFRKFCRNWYVLKPRFFSTKHILFSLHPWIQK